jgi:hypothetical protein
MDFTPENQLKINKQNYGHIIILNTPHIYKL